MRLPLDTEWAAAHIPITLPFDFIYANVCSRIAMCRSLLCLVLLSAFCPKLQAENVFRAAADRPVDIQHIRLELAVSLDQQEIDGTATIEFTAQRTTDHICLNAVGHDVHSVQQIGENGQATDIAWENTGEELLITLAQPMERGQARKIQIAYAVHQPREGLHFFKPTADEPQVPSMVWSQGEPTSNRYWFPCLDHPHERQTTEVIATVDSKYEVLSNGSLVSRKPSADGNKATYHWRQEKPHVAYLVTLVAGEFTVVKEEWRGKPVLYYIPPDQVQFAQASFGKTPRMLDFFSDRFGIEYPWEKYAQVVVEQFTAGGMENTSATTLYEWAIHDERALLTRSPDWLVAHELGHQWWGDLVTCQDWSHLWLNEGFASYCEILWAEHDLGLEEAQYQLVLKSRIARGGLALTRPVVDRYYDDPSQMFDSRAYPKGAWVLHMLRHLSGDDDFFTGLKRYGLSKAYQTAETGDLRHSFSDLTGLSLERFFYDWTERAGHPKVLVKSSYDADEHVVRIDIRQTQSEDAFEFPLTIELQGESEAQTQRIEKLINQKELSLYIPSSSRPNAIRIDPEFGLLAELKEEKSRDWWIQQLSAPSVPERIRAVEHFAESKQDEDRELLDKVLREDAFYGVRVEAAAALGKSGGNKSRDALIAALTDGEARVREACAKGLGTFADDEAAHTAIAEALHKDEPSYGVTASLLDSYAKISDDIPLDIIRHSLEQPSHREVVRDAALRALARSRDAEALPLLLEWTKLDHHRECRRAAIESIAQYCQRHDMPPMQKTEVVDRLVDLLKNDRTTIRRAAADALLELGGAGTPALNVLDSIAEYDPNLRVRSAAKAAATHIRSGSPSATQLKNLRVEMDALREENRGLKERVERMEAR